MTLISFLGELDGQLTPVRLVAQRLVGDDASIETATGAALILHRPQIGSEAYACVLFPGVPAETMTRYEQIHRSSGRGFAEIPEAYRNVLRVLNGATIFRLSLYGLPPSMCQEPPLLDRSSRQPMDLGSANLNWRRKYAAGLELFHFGSGPYSATENIAYFLDGVGRVAALLQGGQRIWEWPSIEAFLTDELSRAESQYASFESRMAAVVKNAAAKKVNAKLRPRQR